jgi:glutaredoxin
MSVAVAYVCIAVITVLGLLLGKEPPTESMIQSINVFITWPNVLIASGVIGVCSRLDKIIKQRKGGSK